MGILGGLHGRHHHLCAVTGRGDRQHPGWRWIFYINLPLVGLLAVMVRRSVEESRDTDAARLDPWGSLTFAGSLGYLIWAMIDANQVGWDSAQTLGRLVISAFLFGLFVMVERSQARPMIDLRLMRSGRFVGACWACSRTPLAPR